jgi:hypothetical protein
MKTNKLPSIEYLNECLIIDPSSPSYLRWKKERPRSHFKSESIYKTWNPQFAGKVAGNKDKYYKVEINNQRFRVHNIIFAIYNNTTQFNDKIIDHIDGNKYNNNPDNLRLVTFSENLQNRKNKRQSKNGFSNIYKKNNKFYCMFNINNKRYYLGIFDSVEEAVKQRDLKGKSLSDNFSRI